MKGPSKQFKKGKNDIVEERSPMEEKKVDDRNFKRIIDQYY